MQKAGVEAMGRITKRKIHKSVYVLEFATQYELAATFLRFQEHYESKKFRGRVFSLEQFMDWYAKEFGNFTYYQDWNGFNIPASALKPFREGLFDPLLDKERRLLRLLHGAADESYIIGITADAKKGGAATLKHELAHALFHTNQVYREAVVALLHRYDTSAIRAELSSLGYCRQVLEDEVHAYVLAGPSLFRPAIRRKVATLRRQLQRLYNAYAHPLLEEL